VCGVSDAFDVDDAVALEYTSWLQPTEQYGQTLVWTLASVSLRVVAARGNRLEVEDGGASHKHRARRARVLEKVSA
jgi:hypothetical protein